MTRLSDFRKKAAGVNTPSSVSSKREEKQTIERTEQVMQITTVKAEAENQDADLKWSADQQALLDCLNKTRDSIFLSGNAGTGKSTCLNHWLLSQGESVVVVAPTGIAALNVGGVTIHSFFGLPPETLSPADVVEFLTPRALEKLRAVKTMVIDEVSMVRNDIFAVMDRMLQFAKGNNLPFGGVRMILVGDLMQLPPVVKQGAEAEHLASLGSAKGWFFSSEAYRDLNPKRFYLTTGFRQKDPKFYELLNRVRVGDRKAALELNKLVQPAQKAPMSSLQLCCTNSSVDQTNETHFMRLSGEKSTYLGIIVDKYPEKQVPVPMHHHLGVGARVMTLKNGTGYVNGSLGEIIELHDNHVVVKIDQGQTVNVGYAEWAAHDYAMQDKKLSKTTKGLYRQIPVKLAWAMTIHKSQGQGFDSAVVDLGTRTFVHGQAYVALSRLRTLEGMYFSRPMRPSDVIVDREVLEFLEGE